MKKITFLFYALCISAQVFGQWKTPEDYPSPNAANLGLYGQIPVSHFTGVPDISIPIHTIQMQEIQLPINLRYHVGSVKPESSPGWTGLGWSLEAGGSITRIINGYRDEMSNYDYARENGGIRYTKNIGYYYYAGELGPASNWAENSFLVKYAAIASRIDTVKIDLEPDEFIFNCAGMSGSFYYYQPDSRTQQYKVKAKQPLDLDISGEIKNKDHLELLTVFNNEKIVNDFSFNDRKLLLQTYFSKFTITDQNGIIYEFGGNTNNIDFVTTSVPGVSNNYKTITTAVTWYLSSITTPNGDRITFEYKKEGDYCINTVFRNRNCAMSTYVNESNNAYCTGAENEDHLTLQHSSYLSKITASSGESIEFITSPSDELEYDYNTTANFGNQVDNNILSDQARRYLRKDYGNYKLRLDQIVISYGSENRKNFYFTYADNTDRRLRLNKLSTDLDTYQFKYNSRYLPDYNSKQTDHWGFYNGKSYESISFSNMITRRTPDTTKMKAETLEEIIYPTGGSTLFEYEAHTYSQVATQYTDLANPFSLIAESGIAGGLRVHRIISRPNAANSEGQIVKEYAYVNTNGSSSGILSGKPIYETILKQYFLGLIAFSWFGMDYTLVQEYPEYVIIVTKGSENFLNPLGNTNGSHITYSRVVEKLSDGSSSIYYYTNHEDHLDEPFTAGITNISNTTAFVESFTSRELGRGLLKALVHRNAGNVRLDSTSYQYSYEYNNYVKTIHTLGESYYYGFLMRLTCNKIYTFIPKMIQETTIRYDSNGSNPVTLTTNNVYNSKNLLSETSFTRNDGKKLVTRYDYPFEVADNFDTADKKMADRRIFSSYVNKIVYLSTPDTTRVIDAEYRKYGVFGTNSKIIRPAEVNTFKKNNTASIEQLFPLGETSFSVPFSGTQSGSIPFDVQEKQSKVIISLRAEHNIPSNDPNIVPSPYSFSITNLNNTNERYTWVSQWQNYGSYYLYTRHDSIILPKGSYYASIAANNNMIINETNFYLLQRQKYIDGAYMQSEVYYKYDNHGNIRESKQAGSNVATTYLWGYKHQYPIAKIENATYEQVRTALSYTNDSQVETLADKDEPITSDWNNINNLRTKLPSAQITVYTYKPLVGLQTVTDPRGIKTTYEYDPYGRLKTIKDENNSTLENYQYHYNEIQY
ncbi:hypothetical protein AGMMS50262_06480 [Bacteroidia bacterium]|nr:hypothetical protein AGMMS50262_06480 [Bacteroidia bacterium]